MAERLQKFLAKSGIGSRRYCEDLIKSGKVIVNGKIPEIGISVEENDIVEIDGKVRFRGNVNEVLLLRLIGK